MLCYIVLRRAINLVADFCIVLPSLQALAGVKSLARDQAMGELATQFEQADAWLRPMRP